MITSHEQAVDYLTGSTSTEDYVRAKLLPPDITNVERKFKRQSTILTIAAIQSIYWGRSSNPGSAFSSNRCRGNGDVA